LGRGAGGVKGVKEALRSVEDMQTAVASTDLFQHCQATGDALKRVLEYREVVPAKSHFKKYVSGNNNNFSC
jgi:hypothetical protein